MRILFCWRCQMEMPMPDEFEFEQVSKLRFQRPFVGGLERMLEAYNGITGIDETNPNAIYHHRIAEHGPPCESCGKPLRTPQASFCAACGKLRA